MNNINRVEDLAKMCNLVAHNLMTPLAAIQIVLNRFSQDFPAFCGSEIDKNCADLLVNSITAARQQSVYIIWYIDLMRRNCQPITELEFEVFSIKAVINKVIAEYPGEYALKDKSLIDSHIDDFQIIGSKSLLKYILYNLLSNAAYAIREIGNGGVIIKSSSAGDVNYIHFMDSARLANKIEVTKIFTPFYTTWSGKLGLGLSFCKSAMLHMAGDIKCIANVNHNIEFVLQFPFATENKL